ncbi:hypothetical protein Y1Q_0018636 [Alligator mississippiensis]|uniref:Uncharacterized protein n=1 Tax=Alligator mississippiensis TaxID=8496 RepID=A0A151NSE8_ALLMI|nr:hypothetical protein Y1Q_0018636 [Alligator mississippiensis]
MNTAFNAGAKNTAIPRRRIFSHDISEQFQRSCEILQGWPNLLRSSNWDQIWELVATDSRPVHVRACFKWKE